MRTALIAACFASALTSCGTTRDQRLQLYQATAAATGHHELATGIGLIRPLLTPPTAPKAAKQPRNVNPAP